MLPGVMTVLLVHHSEPFTQMRNKALCYCELTVPANPLDAQAEVKVRAR